MSDFIISIWRDKQSYKHMKAEQPLKNNTWPSTAPGSVFAY